MLTLDDETAVLAQMAPTSVYSETAPIDLVETWMEVSTEPPKPVATHYDCFKFVRYVQSNPMKFKSGGEFFDRCEWEFRDTGYEG